MRTVVLGTPPPELEALIEKRRALGQDTHDEIWDGEYHMSPAPNMRHAALDHEVIRVLGPLAAAAGLSGTGPFNLGLEGNFRVPDHGFHRALAPVAWVPTAAIVVEIISPDDESWLKLPFYAARGVDEVGMIDPEARTITWLVRNAAGDGYDETPRSALLAVDVADVQAAIRWPA